MSEMQPSTFDLKSDKSLSMWNKIYLIALAAAVLAMGILLYLPYSWLESVTAPSNVALNYNYYSNISWLFLLISSLALLIIGNLVLLRTGKSWAMWASFLYFAVFIIIHTFWLGAQFFRYQQTNNLTDSVFSFGAFFGAVLVGLAAIIVFFNQYLVKRLLDKMNPAAAQPIEPSPDEFPTEENKI